MLYIAGIDANSKGLALVGALYNDNLSKCSDLHMRHWDLMDHSGPDACMWTRKVLARWLRSLPYGADNFYAWVEAPVLAGARNIQTTIKQAFINGVIQAEFRTAGYQVQIVPPSQWKIEVLGQGNGNAPKEDCAAAIKRQWRDAHRMARGNQDLIDATGVHLFGCHSLLLRLEQEGILLGG